MGEQRNLTEENVEELKTQLEKMQESNPDLEYRFFPQEETAQGDAPDQITILKEILAEVKGLRNFFKLTFDNHVLINGKFVNYLDLDKKE